MIPIHVGWLQTQRHERGKKERWRRKKKERERGILGAFGDGSVICKTYRLKGGERWREGEKRKGRRFGDCVAGVPLMSP